MGMASGFLGGHGPSVRPSEHMQQTQRVNTVDRATIITSGTLPVVDLAVATRLKHHRHPISPRVPVLRPRINMDRPMRLTIQLSHIKGRMRAMRTAMLAHHPPINPRTSSHI